MNFNMKVFYFVGMTCFSIQLLMTLIPFIFNFSDYNIYSKIYNIASMTFTAFLVALFYSLYHNETKYNSMINNDDVKKMKELIK